MIDRFHAVMSHSNLSSETNKATDARPETMAKIPATRPRIGMLTPMFCLQVNTQ